MTIHIHSISQAPAPNLSASPRSVKLWRRTLCLLCALLCINGYALPTDATVLTLPNQTWSLAASSSHIDYTWPAPSTTVIRWFEEPEHEYASGHRGIDSRLSVGHSVHSPAAGVVTFAGPVAGRPLIVIDHRDGYRSTLEPVRSDLRPGDEVRGNQIVGHLVTDGSHCLPSICLHWGVRQDSMYVDPLILVGAARKIRLYPTN